MSKRLIVLIQKIMPIYYMPIVKVSIRQDNPFGDICIKIKC